MKNQEYISCLTINDVARMLDISAVQPDSTEQDVRVMAALAIEYDCVACFAMPTYMALLVELLKDYPQINAGGVVGFPSGAVTTETKIVEVLHLLDMGASELDMVINIARLKSGDYKYVYEDIQAVVQAAGKVPVKVILECHYLDDKQIQAACKMVIEAGAAFVKTGTGWAATGATVDNIALIKQSVGNWLNVKAAGGVRDLDILLTLYSLGATRFGVSAKSAKLIFQQMEQQTNDSIHNCL